MEKQIIKNSYDIQSLILSSILSIIIILTLFFITISSYDLVILNIFIAFMLLSIISLLTIYFYTKHKIVFGASKITIVKNGKVLKDFKWHEINIEYLDLEELILLKANCIQLCYYDKQKEKYIDLLIPSKKEVFFDIMKLRNES